MEQWQGLTPEVKKNYAVVHIVKRTAEKELVLLQNRADGTKVLLRNYPGELSVVYQLLAGRTLEHIPRILAAEQRDAGYYVLEEFIEGAKLNRDVLSASAALDVLRQICNALSSLHALGIVHRDIKPDHLLQNADGKVYLLDLDAARLYKNHVDRDTCTLGTTGFAAPEQFGIVQTDHRADIFALGVTLNILLTGYHPSKQLCTGWFRHIVLKCTRIDPKARYQTANTVWRSAVLLYWAAAWHISGKMKHRLALGACAVLCIMCAFLLNQSLHSEALPIAAADAVSSASVQETGDSTEKRDSTSISDDSSSASASDSEKSWLDKLFGTDRSSNKSSSNANGASAVSTASSANAGPGMDAGQSSSKAELPSSSSQNSSASHTSSSKPAASSGVSSHPAASGGSSSSNPSSSSSKPSSSSSKPASSSSSPAPSSSSSRNEVQLYLNEEGKKYRAVEAATNDMANQYMELYNQCYLIQYQLDGLNANCTSCDVNVNTQLAVVSGLQGKLDAALSQDPPADDATLTWYRLELEKEQETLQNLQSTRDSAYAERDAYLESSGLNAQIAASKQSFHAYEEQYPAYLAARQRMIDAQTSVGFTHIVFPHGSEPPEPGTLPRY